jgi:hypothetical protein
MLDLGRGGRDDPHVAGRRSGMSELGSVTSALLSHVSKLVKTLSDDEIKRVAAGEIKLSVVRPGHSVMKMSAALDRALKFMEGLTEDDVSRLEDRQASLTLLRKGGKVVYPLDPRDVAAQVTEQSSEAEMIRLLSADARLTAANLKKVAEALRIVVPSDVKAKTALQLYIAERVASDRGLRA